MTLALACALSGSIAVIVFLAFRVRATSRDLRAATARADSLARYVGIPDAEAYVANLRAEAQQAVAAARAESSAITERALDNARNLELQAARNVEGANEEARRIAIVATSARDTLVAEAEKKAREVTEAASRRAEEIAGDAYRAVQQAKQLEQTVRALKNTIDGYGDAYIIPTQDLLDVLGDEFGFTEAGEQLKAARVRIREMVKEGKAATCDYVEDNRRKTAIDFVTDAFNGKVATILASVREDNHGTLAQKVRDAFTLVNQNGQAFRNARITPEYLDLRLDELKWAVAVQELKAREREEQRELKERMREEERAQREFERAAKEAERDEEALRKAMEKAQAQFDKASDAQKQKYEEQLHVIAEKLKEAEERGKRALSMAQQTKSGHVYVISNIGSFGEHVYKIGLTRRLEPEERIRELGDASVPFGFDVHALIPSEDAPALEHALHKKFVRGRMNKVNPRKEFFRVTLEEIRSELETIGCIPKWTLAAECREYKETLAIERAMRERPEQVVEWIAKQGSQRTRVRAAGPVEDAVE